MAKWRNPEIAYGCPRCKGSGTIHGLDVVWLIRERMRVGLSGRELARRVGVSPSYMHDIENKRREPSEQTRKRIIRVLENCRG